VYFGIVAYLLKARIAKPGEEPLLGTRNCSLRRKNAVIFVSDIFPAGHTKALYVLGTGFR
jgi:hypothetical protein